MTRELRLRAVVDPDMAVYIQRCRFLWRGGHPVRAQFRTPERCAIAAGKMLQLLPQGPNLWDSIQAQQLAPLARCTVACADDTEKINDRTTTAINVNDLRTVHLRWY